MVDFLSAEWFEALSSIEVMSDPGLTFRLDQWITGAPGGDCRYRVTLTAGQLRVDPLRTQGPDGDRPADATLRLTYPTAVGLAAGTRTVHDALLAREVTFDGDPARIQELGAALTLIGTAMTSLRAVTTWPAPSGERSEP